MWRANNNIGFVEIESDYARLLKNEDGVKWSSTIVYPEINIWSALKKAIPSFFAPKTTLNFICPVDAGTMVLEFPANLNDKEIEGNLQVNRRNIFNEAEELYFKLKRGSTNYDTQKRDITASYAKLSTIDSIKNLCLESNVKLGKISTLPDSLLGAIYRQYKKNSNKEVNICIHIGYSKVSIIIFKGTEILSVRNLLTGSIRELESVLFAGYSLSKEDTRLMISGRHPQPVPAILDTIKDNRLDLITHLGGIFAELRTKKLLDPKSEVFLSYNIIDEPLLTNMIGERFDIKVNIITGLEDEEKCEKYEDYPAVWLCGSDSLTVPNLIPPVKISVFSFIFNPVTAVIIAILMTIVPLPILNLQKQLVVTELDKLKLESFDKEKLLNDYKALDLQSNNLKNLTKDINQDLDNRGMSSDIARQLSKKLPQSTRLESLQLDYKIGRIIIVGYTVDAESALLYLDKVKACEALTNPEIIISDLETRRIKFTITALIGNGKGRK